MLETWHSAAMLALLALAVPSCGGNTDDVRDGGNAGGAGGSGGSTGGSGGSTGGSGGSGGSGATGGSTGGSGGSAGSSGSGGNSGRGGSGGTANHGACTLSSQCLVRPRSCCGSCGAATRTDVTAINRGNTSNYMLEVCGEEFGCPPCYTAQDPTLVSRCVDNNCAVVDLNALPLTACSVNSDCRVRVTSCCECGGNVQLDALIAIRRDSEAEYTRLMCDPMQACDDCVPPYPQGAIGVCYDGRCTVSGFSGATPQAP
jgi:hypothetical protein